MDLGSTSPVLFALTGRQRTIRITPEFHLTFASSQDTCFALLSVEVITQGASKMLTDSERATTADVYLMHPLPVGEEMKRDLYTSQILDADSPGLPGKEDSPRYMRICPQTNNNSQRQPPHHIPDECCESVPNFERILTCCQAFRAETERKPIIISNTTVDRGKRSHGNNLCHPKNENVHTQHSYCLHPNLFSLLLCKFIPCEQTFSQGGF